MIINDYILKTTMFIFVGRPVEICCGKQIQKKKKKKPHHTWHRRGSGSDNLMVVYQTSVLL